MKMSNRQAIAALTGRCIVIQKGLLAAAEAAAKGDPFMPEWEKAQNNLSGFLAELRTLREANEVTLEELHR